jgi:hypothetical protein
MPSQDFRPTCVRLWFAGMDLRVLACGRAGGCCFLQHLWRLATALVVCGSSSHAG